MVGFIPRKKGSLGLGFLVLTHGHVQVGPSVQLYKEVGPSIEVGLDL